MRLCSAKKKILIVEDDPVLRALLARVLAPDYEVVVACDGAEAVSRAQSQEFDVLLTDLRLPVIDGLQVACMIRNISRDIKIVLHTASADSIPPDAMSASPIDMVIRKGLSIGELRSRIASLLAVEGTRTTNV